MSDQARNDGFGRDMNVIMANQPSDNKDIEITEPTVTSDNINFIYKSGILQQQASANTTEQVNLPQASLEEVADESD